ncbi:MAG: hypothetical protein ACPGO5_03635 [Patescibacteria group bacterium]
MSEKRHFIASFFGWLVVVLCLAILFMWIAYVFPDTARKWNSFTSFTQPIGSSMQE